MNNRLMQKNQTTTLPYFLLKQELWDSFTRKRLFLKKDRFREFHDYTLMCGQPMATVLLSPQGSCKNCHKQLSLDPKPHPVGLNQLKERIYIAA